MSFYFIMLKSTVHQQRWKEATPEKDVPRKLSTRDQAKIALATQPRGSKLLAVCSHMLKEIKSTQQKLMVAGMSLRRKRGSHNLKLQPCFEKEAVGKRGSAAS